MDKRIVRLRADLVQVANEDDSLRMQAYMQELFPFMGIKSPLRRSIASSHIKSWLTKDKALDTALVKALWAEPEREFQYIAIDYMSRTKRSWLPSHLSLFESLILTKSWWDTVDLIAATLVGGLLQQYPALKSEMLAWNKSTDMWKVRSSIIYQLKYTSDVDFEQLSECIIRHAHSKDFFLQKASGWALRQYSKYSPGEVREFIASQELAPLTIREASKYI